METTNIYYKSILAVIMIWMVTGCSLDIENPNGPVAEQIETTRDGIITLSVGMRQTYSTAALESIVLTPGTTARELRGINTGTNIIEIDQGGSALPNFNGNITSVWQRPLRVMGMADDILTNGPVVLAAEPALLSGIIAHAKLLKAMCLGSLAQSFTAGILETSLATNASFVSREELLSTALTLLTEAQQTLSTTPPSTEFFTRVTGTDFNLPNTILAYHARYALMAGKYQEAIAAAQAVSPTVASKFMYTNQAPNPLYQQVQVAKNFAARENFGLPADLVEVDDKRLKFYLTTTRKTHFQGDSTDALTGFATSITQPIPAYIPDEMKLIIAEANVRGNLDITVAVNQINAVRTQVSGDPFGIHPNLPAYGGAVTTEALLKEIYKQRCAELYLSGLRLEDSRRFGRTAPPADVVPVPLTYERSRNFYPFPQQERQNNINTPADPSL